MTVCRTKDGLQNNNSYWQYQSCGCAIKCNLALDLVDEGTLDHGYYVAIASLDERLWWLGGVETGFSSNKSKVVN